MMISVEKARELLLDNSQAIPDILQVSVEEACGYVLAEDILSPYDLPHFKQSSVDGYGIKLSQGQIKKEYKVISVVKAGDVATNNPKEDECIRIFTGAMVAEDIDMMIMQEDVEEAGGKIRIRKELKPNTTHIRLKGSQIKKGELSMQAGQLLNPSAIGFLQAMGIQHIQAFRKPKVSILVGGDELIRAGEAYRDGKVYESNAYPLKAAIEKEGAVVQEIKMAKDSKEELSEKFAALLEDGDVVLVSGGISVGDYDYVSQVFEEAGVHRIFHGVLQKPGKPIYFGTMKEKLVFGLPGNPASTLSCFYEYVLPALRKMMHKKALLLPCMQLPLSTTISKNINLGVFLKASVNEKFTEVKALEGQESYILSSFAVANALIYVAAGKAQITAGEIVQVHLLPE